MLWLLNHTEQYPKRERFRLAKRMEDTSFDFYENLVQAVHAEKPVDYLSGADIKLDQLRLLVRLSFDRKLMSIKQYEYISKTLLEIGKLLGGWKAKKEE